MMQTEHRLPVIEMFGPTLQGEGRVIGLKTMFVRLAGCDYACGWCDTKYAWEPGHLAKSELLAPESIMARLEKVAGGCRRVTLSGGNPALHHLGALLARLRERDWLTHMETQGSLAPAWLRELDSATFSPKPPSSGMLTDWEKLREGLALCREPDLKVVVFDDGDYDYAVEVHRRFPDVLLTLQLGNRVGEDTTATLLERLNQLAERALADPRLGDVRVLPQLHVLLWGNRRGV